MMYNKIEFFQSYFARASEKKLVVDSLAPRLNQISDDFHMLDLGCHDGALIKSIFEQYQSATSPSIKITAVDPSETAIAELANSEFASRYHVSTYAGTAESYFDNHHTHFDWILASQCLYWSKNLSHIIRQIHQASDSALIVLRGKKGIYDIQHRFKSHLGNAQEQLYTAEDIEKTLIALDIAYKRVNHTTHITLPEPDTEAFNWLTGFFLQNENIEDDVDALTEIKKYILQHTIHGSLEHEVAFFWLGKFI